MKTKRWALVLFLIGVCSMLYILPTSAKAKAVSKTFRVSRKEVLLYEGETKTLFTGKIRLLAGDSGKVYWKTMNKRIATVSVKGEVKAKKAGKTTVYVVSKRNPKVKASVCVVVKKRPKKVEKVCNMAGAVFENDDTALEASVLLKGKIDQATVLRSKEDFFELKRAINANSKWIGGLKYKNCCLKTYEKIDFSRTSLVLVSLKTSANLWKPQFISCSTSFDTNKKLCGVVKIQVKKANGEGSFLVTMNESTVILLMAKKDAAMIDYFKIETENTEIDKAK